ncbi:TetR/AcrR family transcriptional regulator, partial [Arthrobacter deserti]|nr:TetR/AcrR family transcriptional regulator [Arthrobacter deserti]
DAGFDEAEAVQVYRALADFMLSWTGFSAGLRALGEKSGQDDAAWAAEYARAPAHRFPHAVALAGQMAAIDDDGNFDFALELLLDGVEARLRSRS